MKELVLSAPTMSESQFEDYKEFRSYLENWREE
jgi:hypothetical protein